MNYSSDRARLNESTQKKANPEENKGPTINPTKKLMKYMRKELSLFIWSTIALIIGNAGQFVVPIYIGWFVDDMQADKYDTIASLCWQLLGFIVVR